MTGDAKLLKLSSIAGLFVGLGTLAFGVFLAVGNLADIDAWTTAAEGLLTAIFGARTAILANVPSNTAKIRTKALVVSLAAVGVEAYFAYARQGVTAVQIALAGVICSLVVFALVISHRIVRDQLRK